MARREEEEEEPEAEYGLEEVEEPEAEHGPSKQTTRWMAPILGIPALTFSNSLDGGRQGAANPWASSTATTLWKPTKRSQWMKQVLRAAARRSPRWRRRRRSSEHDRREGGRQTAAPRLAKSASSTL